MATVKHQLPSLTTGVWTEVADVEGTDVNVYMENQGNTVVEINFKATAPAGTEPGHKLGPGQSLPRVANGKIYARNPRGSTKPGVLVVSK